MWTRCLPSVARCRWQAGMLLHVVFFWLSIARAADLGDATRSGQDAVATILVLRDDGTTGSDVLVELHLPENGPALPDNWRLCFTWMKTIVLQYPPDARKVGSYVELPPQPALGAGKSRAIPLRIAPPAMRYASDLPQALHVVIQTKTVAGATEERVLPVLLRPPAENSIRRDPDGLPKHAALPLLVPRPATEETGQGAGFALVGPNAGAITVVVETPDADSTAKLFQSWMASWPSGAPLEKGTAIAKLAAAKPYRKKRGHMPSSGNDNSGASDQRRIIFAPASDSADKNWFGSEGYELDLRATEVRIVAAAPDGFHRGVATFRQTLGLAHSDGKDEIPPFRIRDRPRFAYRGVMLDVARHFFPASFVKQMLDWMYLLKLNVFHWHLTDDEGWRFEVRALPNLTARGAWRGRGEAIPPQYGGGPGRYGGFYTQEEIREIVEYASTRGIVIVPEVDVPGHCFAAIRALPGLLGDAVRRPAESGKSPTSVQGFQGNVLDPASRSTYVFLEAVFTELMELFPAPLGIHVGMDEVPRGAWSDNLEDEAALLADLAHWLQRFLADRGRSLLGWEEAFYDERSLEVPAEASKTRAVAVAWKEDERFAVKAASRGFDVVLSPAHFLYLDIVQGMDFEERGLYWACPTLPVERVYSYEPLERLRRFGLKPGAEARIRGVQAALWSETVATPERAQEMLFPRLFAVAEIGWTAPERRAWNDFKWRLSPQLRWLRDEEAATHYGGGMCGLVLGAESMILPRSPPHGSGGPAGIADLPAAPSCRNGGRRAQDMSPSSCPAVGGGPNCRATADTSL